MRRNADSYYWLRIILIFAAAVCCAATGAWAGNALKAGPGQQYAAIQPAVDAAQTGDAILVYPSTYPESVSVTKNGISIVAQGSGVVVGPPPVEKKACFEVKADGVVIYGFELTGTMMAPGIRFEGSHNRFSGNRIYGLGGLGVNAIDCYNSNGGTDFNVIDHNDITGADLGIEINCGSKTAVNKGNMIIGNHVHDVGSLGIGVLNGVECTIADNVIEEVPFGYGISVGAAANQTPQHSHLVTGNTISGAAIAGIVVMPTQTTNLTKVTVSPNQIGSSGIGIWFTKDSGARLADNVVSDNSISGAQNTGIQLDNGVNKNQVVSNVILGSAIYGIQANGDHNGITSNTVLESGMLDLADGGKGNRWKENVYETCSWNP
jgi:hypothetical protein